MLRVDCSATLLCAAVVCAFAPEARAAPPDAAAAERAPLTNVEIALVAEADRDPLLFERIRSLFAADTAVTRRGVDRLDVNAVLRPERTDTVYLWIRISEQSAARVYLSVTEADGNSRYLVRELQLDAGLDEVGSEMLAQVVHSSVQALWRREQQTSRQAVLAALEREIEPPPPAPAPVPVAPAPRPAAKPEPKTASLRFAVGASDTAHASGAEGWLHEPGAFLAFEHSARLSLRVAVRYLVPTEFDVLPARVRLSGSSAELRAGWLSSGPTHVRVRLEAGLGILLAHVGSSLAAMEPPAHASTGRDVERVHALAAAAIEWPLGPAWLAAGADLRVPLRRTSYDIGGGSGGRESASLSPGGMLEIGVGFEPGAR